MFRWSILGSIYIVFIVTRVSAQNNSVTNSTHQPEFKYPKYFKNLNVSNMSDVTKEVISQVITKKCLHQYSITCLKLDIGKLIDKLFTTRSFQILPGISLVNTENITQNRTDMPVEVAVSLVRANNNNNELNSYLMQKISKYVGSLSVRVNLIDNPILENLKDITYVTFNDFFYPMEETGRSQKKGKQDIQAVLWSAAMLAALGFSGLVALAGKAMLTGTLALVLSLVCLLRGCGGHRAAHYEIITKPAHLHDVEHLGYPGSALSSGQYGGYARHLMQDRVIPSLNIVDTGDSSDEKELVREVIPIHTYQMTPNYSPSSMIHR